MLTKNSTGTNISPAFVAASKAVVRKPRAMVEFLWTDSAVDPLLSVDTTDKNHCMYTEGEVLKQTTDSIEVPAYKYIALDGSWALDGSKHPAPYTAAEVNEYQIGWYSDSLSDEDGDFTSIPFPSLTVNFDPAGRALTSLKVVGDALLKQYPVNFTITVYSASTVLHTETVTNNAAVSWFKNISNLGITDAVRMKLEIGKWSTGNTVAKILEFFTIETDTFVGDEIVSMRLLEERSVKNGSSPIGNISLNELELTLQNIEIVASDGVTYYDPFSFGNSVNNRFYNFLKPNRKIIAYLGFNTGEQNELVRMGTFWTVGDWRCSEMDFSASVTAHDRMKFLKDNTFECDEISNTMRDRDLKWVAEYVLNHAKNNIPLRDLVWDISDELKNYIVPIVWFGKGSYFDAIKAIAEACIGQAWMTKEDVLCIYPEKVIGNTDLQITKDDYFDKDQPSNIDEMRNVINVSVQAISKEGVDEKQVIYDGLQYTVAANSETLITIEYGNAPVSESQASILNPVPEYVELVSAKYLSYGCILNVKNIANEPATFDIQVKAWKWELSSNNIVTSKNDLSIKEYGKKEENFENHLIQTSSLAQTIASKQLINSGIPRRDLSLTWRGDPRLELGDVVEVPEYKSNTAKFAVVKSTWTFDGGLECRTEARKVSGLQ